MANTLNKTGISTGLDIKASHVTQSIDAFSGTEAYDITLSGSLEVTGSTKVDGDIYGGNIVSSNILQTNNIYSPSGTTIFNASVNVPGFFQSFSVTASNNIYSPLIKSIYSTSSFVSASTATIETINTSTITAGVGLYSTGELGVSGNGQINNNLVVSGIVGVTATNVSSSYFSASQAFVGGGFFSAGKDVVAGRLKIGAGNIGVSPVGSGFIEDLYVDTISSWNTTGTITNFSLSATTVTTSGNLTVGGTPICATQTNFSPSSDIRLKENIITASIDTCYDNVKSLPLKHYKWKDGVQKGEIEDKHVLGWVAQDVESILPNAISKSDFTTWSTFTGSEAITGSDNKTILKPGERYQDVLAGSEILEDKINIQPDQIMKMVYGAVQKLQEKVEALEAQISGSNS